MAITVMPAATAHAKPGVLGRGGSFETSPWAASRRDTRFLLDRCDALMTH
jgi:hypothetical protein